MYNLQTFSKIKIGVQVVNQDAVFNFAEEGYYILTETAHFVTILVSDNKLFRF